MTEPSTFPELIKTVLEEVRHIAAQPDSTNELSYRPAVITLLKHLPAAMGMPDIDGVPLTEPKRKSYGTPDFKLKMQNGWLIGYLEAKGVHDDLRAFERSAQIDRYRESGQRIVLTNLLEFMLIDKDPSLGAHGSFARVDSARLVSLDGLLKGQAPHAADVNAVQLLFRRFLRQAEPDISTPKELAIRLAAVARQTADVLMNALYVEPENSSLHDLKRAFQQSLLPDLPNDQFADMYAQTIAYGLFAAAWNHDSSKGLFTLDSAWHDIPKTNPFLRKLFESITGSELEDQSYSWLIEDLVSVLGALPLEDILKEFGRRTKTHDPVVHFYEDFLAAYNPKLRELRGVYYTPEPVVSYIVRSVDAVLKNGFGVTRGLADATTVPSTTGKSTSRVLVLDPAAGTGTFLYQVIDLIREQFTGNAGNWSDYVREHLLDRVFGFELLMAPYAVAHLKLGAQLAGRDLDEPLRSQLRFDFKGEERLNIFLTNTLEQALTKSEHLFGPLGAIADEANAAARVKNDLPIMAVLGNPPYSGHSANARWRLVRDTKDPSKSRRIPTWIGELMRDYYQIGGVSISERNPKWLQDDYVKFIRFAQWRISKTGAGVLAFVTNHSYLDNPTFRGMRHSLMRDFSDIYLLNLHGNERKHERAPGGLLDQNVFDIQQGVAIGIFVRDPARLGSSTVRYADLWGLREHKYEYLLSHVVGSTEWTTLEPTEPLHLFIPQDKSLRSEYEVSPKLTDIMRINVLGFQSHRDQFAVAFDRDNIKARISDLRSSRSNHELAELYGLHDNRDWKLADARKQVKADENWEATIIRCLYRPFDWRWCYFSTVAMDYPRRELCDHMLQPNLSLNTMRQTKASEWHHVLVADAPTPAVFVEIKDGSTVFPLYLYEPQSSDSRQGPLILESNNSTRVNLSAEFVNALSERTGLNYSVSPGSTNSGTFGPEDVLHYIYAVLYCPSYRERYVQFLKSDFPRIPLVSDRQLFWALCEKGADIVGLHLFRENYPYASWNRNSAAESPFERDVPLFPIAGSNRIEQIRLVLSEEASGVESLDVEGRLYISPDGVAKLGQYFSPIPKYVWESRAGGYQVCEKYLKDRMGRVLRLEEREHFARLVIVVRETIRLESEIDELIPSWPLA